MDPLRARFYDLRLLLPLHDALDALDPGGPPVARVLWPPGDPPSVGRAGVLAGSFNPPTLAHTALLEHARCEQGVAHAWFLLSKHIVDKERVSGAMLEDRLLLLRLIAESRPGFGVVLTNRGLYVDQALALRSVLGPAVEIIFVVGYDKIVQIFDPRYYTDRDTALAQLFAQASFLAAPRAGYTSSAGRRTAASLRECGRSGSSSPCSLCPLPRCEPWWPQAGIIVPMCPGKLRPSSRKQAPMPGHGGLPAVIALTSTPCAPGSSRR